MGSESWHRISEINVLDSLGTCSQCGPSTEITIQKGSWACVTKRRQRKRSKTYNGHNNDTRRRWTRAATELHPYAGECEICGKNLEKPCIDHDHLTGALRGYLCRQCNTGIGMLQDDIATIEKALKYLKNSQAN